MDLKKRFQSFRFAGQGVYFLIASQPNARIHLAATGIVTLLGWLFKLRNGEWCLLVVAITLVWLAEAMNTVFELLADAVTTDFHPLIKHAKDVAAGAVLLAVIGAIILGAFIFLPHLAPVIVEILE
jgi:diacylglycerol kinase (ATP)